jgi:hypothetical protein
MVELIREKYAKYYHAQKSSKVFVFCLFMYMLIAGISFLVAFSNQNSNSCVCM